MKFIKIFIISICLLFGGIVNSYSQNIESISSTVEFVVNTNEFVHNEDYDNFIKNTVHFINNNADDIENILLIGCASPEGNKKRNIHLANIRADKIHSYFKGVMPIYKINVINDYDLFLEKTGVDEKDWPRLRATYIEIHLKTPEIITQIDTVYIRERDTIYVENTFRDTVYIKERPELIPILAVKTNVAADAIATPNVQAELYTHLWGLSLEFDYTFPWWHKDYDTYFYYQILDGKAGIRKYFNNQYYGHWVGIYANTSIYDICFWNKDKGWQGEVYGAGIGYGYVFRHKKYPRLKFEPYIRLGWFNTKFDKYHASQPWNEKYYYDWYLRAEDFVPRRFNMNYFGPTELGFNLTFDLICIRKY